MKKLYFRFRVLMMTFALGLASVFMFNGSLQFSDEIYVNSPHIQSETPLIVIPTEANFISNNVGIMITRGCGFNGSSGTTWHMPSGKLSEGVICGENNKESKKEFHKLLAKSKIIERVENVKNRRGQIGERIVLVVTEKHEKRAEIIWYNDGKCYNYISAPTLELVLDFEKSDFYKKQYLP